MSATSRRPIPAPKAERLALVRKLLALRIENDAQLKANLAEFGGAVDDLSDDQLITSPEIGVLGIYEQYTALIELGVSEEEAIDVLHKALCGALQLANITPPEVAFPVTMEDYARRMIAYGNITSVSLDPELVPRAIIEIKKFYGRL